MGFSSDVLSMPLMVLLATCLTTHGKSEEDLHELCALLLQGPAKANKESNHVQENKEGHKNQENSRVG